MRKDLRSRGVPVPRGPRPATRENPAQLTNRELEVLRLVARGVGAEMPDDIAWIRSYVLEEPDGSVGTVCVYQASSPEAVRAHAGAAKLPVDEIVKVADTVIVRPDPASTT